MTADALELAVDALAGFRLTRLVTRDKITEPLRDAVIADAYRHANRPAALAAHDAGLPKPTKHGDWTAIALEDPNVPKAAAFFVCPWCVGFYVAIGVGLARRWLPGWEHAARVLAVSGATGLLAAQQ